MFPPSEVGVIGTTCANTPGAQAGANAVNTRNAQRIALLLQRLGIGENGAVRFGLGGELAAGGSANATLLRFNGTSYESFIAITVYDEDGIWTGVAGDQGWCTLREGTDTEYSIIFMGPTTGDDPAAGGIGYVVNLFAGVDFITFTLTGALNSGSASATVTGYSGTSPGSTVTVYDPTAIHSRSLTGSKGVAFFNDNNSRYEVVECQQIDFWRGTTDAAISKGASGTVSRYTAGTNTDSTVNDAVYNGFASVGSGKVVGYIYQSGVYYMISAECPLT